MSVFEKFKAYFAGTAGKDEAKSEESFNDFFAKEVSTAVGSAYDAKAAELETRLKALEQKEAPQAFDASELSAKIEALQTAKTEADTQISNLSTELAKVKLSATAKPAANAGNEPPSLVTTEEKKPFIKK